MLFERLKTAIDALTPPIFDRMLAILPLRAREPFAELVAALREWTRDPIHG